MLHVRLQIGDGEIKDTQEWGMVYLNSDYVAGPPSKGFESTAYPEEEGEHILAETVDDAFDYEVSFFVQPSSSQTANQLIAAFNEAMISSSDGDVKQVSRVTFYNDHRRVKIVGYPKPISEAEKLWRDVNDYLYDVYSVKWTIRVTEPSLCNFKAAE